jgi:hypothetical protein
MLNNSRGRLNRIVINGLANEWARLHGDSSKELAFDLANADRVAELVTDAERSHGVLRSAATAIDEISRYPVIMGLSAEALTVFGCFVAEYILETSSGIVPENAFADEAILRRVVDIMSREEVHRVDLLEPVLFDLAITAAMDTPKSAGVGRCAEVVVAITGLDEEERRQVVRVANRARARLKEMGFDVHGPNDHCVSRDPGAVCSNASTFDVLVVVGQWASWRGGAQVHRAHDMGRPVLALVPEGATLSCLFTDPSEGLTKISTFLYAGAIDDALGVGLQELEAAIEWQTVSRSVRRTRYEVEYYETLGAVRRYNADELRARLPPSVTVEQVYRSVESIDTWAGCPRQLCDDIRVAVDLDVVGEVAADPYRSLLSVEHRLNIEAFAEGRDLDLGTVMQLEKRMLSDFSAALASSDEHFRLRRHLTPADLEAALREINNGRH